METSSGIAVASAGIILTTMVLGIILGYAGGLGIDLTSGITDTTWQTKTSDFIVQGGDLGFGILKFNYLVALEIIAFGVLALFYARGGGGM